MTNGSRDWLRSRRGPIGPSEATPASPLDAVPDEIADPLRAGGDGIDADVAGGPTGVAEGRDAVVAPDDGISRAGESRGVASPFVIGDLAFLLPLAIPLLARPWLGSVRVAHRVPTEGSQPSKGLNTHHRVIPYGLMIVACGRNKCRSPTKPFVQVGQERAKQTTKAPDSGLVLLLLR